LRTPRAFWPGAFCFFAADQSPPFVALAFPRFAFIYLMSIGFRFIGLALVAVAFIGLTPVLGPTYR
jgi:hypothetical protein